MVFRLWDDVPTNWATPARASLNFLLLVRIKLDLCNFYLKKPGEKRTYITSVLSYKSHIVLFKNIFFFIYFQREGKRGRQTSIVHLSHIPTWGPDPQPGMRPDRNWTGDLLLCRMMPNPLSHTGQVHIVLTTFSKVVKSTQKISYCDMGES